MKVSSQKDPAVNLSQYRTFDWAPAPASAPARNSLEDKQFRYSVQTDLAKIGVQPAQPGTQPDFYIAYAASTQNIVTGGSGVGLGVGVGVFPGIGVGVSAPVGSQTSVSQQGTFTLSFLDARKHDEIWRGTAIGTLEGSNQDTDTIQKAVREMVGDFENARQKAAA